MFHRHRATGIGVLIPAVALAALPALGWAWGGATHHYIAQNYSQHLPAYMDGLKAYDSVVDQHVTDPDTRKSYTPGESYRHYIDIDSYPEFFSGTLTHDRATLEAQYGASTVLNNGVLPWAVEDVVLTLVQQFQNEQWSDAALTIADLCHYVGDANQPLHCTENYNGQYTGNSGIHSRYESTMMNSHIGDLHTSPMAVAFYSSPVDAMFDIITHSWNGVSVILQADDAAKAASGGSYNSVYYNTLWTNTETMTRSQVDLATVETASFVYTAWMYAGQPPVPGSTASVPLPPMAGVHLQAGPSPFRDVLNIHYAGAGPLSVDVYDMRGARIARVVSGASGEGTATWRPAGNVASGIYFIRLSGPGASMVRRVTWLR